MSDQHGHDYDDTDVAVGGNAEQARLLGEPDADAAAAAPPALPRHRRQRPAHRSAFSTTSIKSIASIHVPKVHDGDTIVNLLCIVLLVASSAGGFFTIPMTRLVEDAVCHKHYEQMQRVDGPIDESLCKLDSIQERVAYIFAMYEFIQSICGFTAAFPWGIAADRIGRKMVVGLAITGMGLACLWIMMVLAWYTVIPLWVLLLAGGFHFVGGGNAMISASLLSMVSDVIPEERRAVSFMRFHVAAILGNLVSPALCSIMMAQTGPWPCMWVSLALLFGGTAAFMFIPETGKHKQQDAQEEASGHPVGFKAHVAHIYDRLLESLSIVKSPSVILLLLTCTVSIPTIVAILQFLVQFISKRYHMSIGDTGYVQTAYGIAQVFQSLLVLPYISKVLVSDSTPWPFKMKDEKTRDLWLARYSYGALVLGFLWMGAATSLASFVVGLFVLSLGSGFNSITRSLMSLYVDPEHRSRLFSLVGMAEVVGSMYGPPMLAGLFALGMRLGGAWIGLPYWGMAGLCLLVIGALVFVRVPRDRRSEDDETAVPEHTQDEAR
ncbi:major facilitator superfamily transporter [Apiospora arundinis]|uniref:Major facilitator superfamily transporter n=1 Tax=Apiospora arundinis TaxID=335852 RepID=A0ABR2HSL8_9PEZI